ncbi:unnamed protein product [Ectocarpus sp. 6 AP-2014]
MAPANDLVDRLRSSSKLRQPTPTETAWFSLQARAGKDSVPAVDSAARVSVRLRCASLSLILREVDGKVEMLMIKRAVSLRDKWSGHIALPGGRQEPGESELQTAVRECQEEVGISLMSSRFALLGRLKDSKTSTSKDALTVSCFVFVQTDKTDIPVTIQEAEVAFAWWVDTAIFYPDPAPREVGFAVTSMVKAARKPHWKGLMWLFGANTVFFPCFFLPPPSVSGQQQSLVDDSTIDVPTPVAYPLDAKTFVMWGLTFGVVSDLVVAGGGRGFAHRQPPYFRFHSVRADTLANMFCKIRRWPWNLRRALSSSFATLRLRQ